MTAITIRSFSGIAPRIPARYLDNSQAQIAINCPAWRGSLTAFRGLSADVAALEKAGVIQSAYRFGEDVVDAANYWLHWTGDVDVVPGMIADDSSERTFYTGDGKPKATNSSLAITGGTNYPVASYMLGLPAPDVAPDCVVSGSGSSGAVADARVYTYTWVNSWGEESAPYSAATMPESATCDVKTGQTVTVTLPVPPTGDHNITHKRIYRSTVGSDGSVEYLFVAQIEAATLTYDDEKGGAALGEAMTTTGWLPPPTDLQGLIGLANGILVGFKGNEVYLSEPWYPYAFPLAYQQVVDYPVVGLGRADTTVFVLTKGRPYYLQGSHPDSMYLVESEISQACVSKRSIVSMAGGAIYATPDGLGFISNAGAKVLTEKLFSRDQWQLFKPESIQAYEWEGKYVAFFDTGTQQGGFVFDPASGAFIQHDLYATAGYNDLRHDALYVVVDGAVKQWDAGDLLAYTWKSKRHGYPTEKKMGYFRVEAETYPVTVKIWADDALVIESVVDSRKVMTLPPTRGRDWEVQIEGSAEVFGVVIATNPSEVIRG